MVKTYLTFLTLLITSQVIFTQDKLGKLIVQNSELAMENAIPTKVSYPNTSILYTHIFNQNNSRFNIINYFK